MHTNKENKAICLANFRRTLCSLLFDSKMKLLLVFIRYKPNYLKQSKHQLTTRSIQEWTSRSRLVLQLKH